MLADAFGDETFCRALVAAIGAGEQLKLARGTLHFKPTRAFARIAGDAYDQLPVALPGAQSSNTIATLGERMFVKGYRRVQAGLNAEVEIGRFLTDTVQFPNSVPVAGSVDYVAGDGQVTTLVLLQAYVENQGNGWDYTQNYLDRLFEQSPGSPTLAGATPDLHGGYVALVHSLGVRTAELHAAFARRTGDPAFDPEPILPADVARWTQRVRGQATGVLDLLNHRRETLPEPARTEAEALLARRGELLARVDALAASGAGAKIRVHGDYHLGQVLLVQNDFVIIDFEGEPTRSLAERAEKQTAMKDVAGMLRSFDYAMHAALLHVGPVATEIRAQQGGVGRRWQAETRTAFLDGYEKVGQTAGLVSPRGEGRGLLSLMLLEKGLYELKYELDNRPDWVRIPLGGLSDILDAAP